MNETRDSAESAAVTECHYIPTMIQSELHSAIKLYSLMPIKSRTLTRSSSTYRRKQFRPYGIQIFAHETKQLRHWPES